MVWRLIGQARQTCLDDLIRQALDRAVMCSRSLVESPLCTVSRCGSFKAGIGATPPQNALRPTSLRSG
jgi:hypothetical protein